MKWFQIKRHSQYVNGILGMDIKLTFSEKTKLLFCKGIQIFVGDVIPKEDE